MAENNCSAYIYCVPRARRRRRRRCKCAVAALALDPAGQSCSVRGRASPARTSSSRLIATTAGQRCQAYEPECVRALLDRRTRTCLRYKLRDGSDCVLQAQLSRYGVETPLLMKADLRSDLGSLISSNRLAKRHQPLQACRTMSELERMKGTNEVREDRNKDKFGN